MLPHPDGEAQSIAHAFNACSLAFHELDPQDLDDDARSWFTKIVSLMDTSQVRSSGMRGTHVLKAETLSLDDKLELKDAIDQLADWFDRAWSERQ
jgi:hypothetical protein